MSIAELAIRRKALTWALSVAVLILGWLAYRDLPRLAAPRITVREVRVITPYPGASAAEVEREISDKIERVARGLGQLRRVDSYSSRGLSVVDVTVQDKYDTHALPRIRDELRQRIGDLQPELPPGAGPSTLDEDLGDIYGLYYALTGEGFTPGERKRVAELVQRELSTLEGVKKVVLFGEQQETIFVELSTTRAEELGVGYDQILGALHGKNLAADAGRIRIGPEHVPIHPGRLYRSEQDLSDLMIAAGRDRLIRLGEVAEIRRGYEDPPQRLLKVDGRPAVGIAVSAVPGGDLVALGAAVERRLAELRARIPVGMELEVVALQSDAVSETVGDFTAYLAQGLTLLIAALLLFMGIRGGLVVAFVTLLTLAGTFLVMDWLQIPLDRVSLGALVIASGLITGNSILVVAGMKARMARGMAGIAAAREAAARNVLPLLAGTAVSVLAFAPVAGVDKGTGEVARPLFLVIPAALTISWGSAVTIAPLLGDRLLESGTGGEGGDLYGKPLHRLYARILGAALRRRWSYLGVTALLTALSLYGFGYVKQIRFPPSTAPGFQVEVFFRAGTHIRETERRMDEIQAYLQGREGISRVVTAIGDHHPRSLPVHNQGPAPGSHYGLSLVFVTDQRKIDAIRSDIQRDLETRLPDALVNVKRRVQALDTAGALIQLRISGPDPAELRRMADRVKTLIAADPDAKAVRDDWGAKVKVAQPLLAHDLAHRLHIERPQIAAALRTVYSGTRAGYFREDGTLIPIVVRAPKEERSRVEDMTDIQVTSPLRGDKVSMRQLVERLDTLTEDPRRLRRDRLLTITVHADARQGRSPELLARIKPRVEKALDVDLADYPGRTPGLHFEIGSDSIPILPEDRIPLKGRPGYYVAWGGEAESSAESRAQLLSWLPLCLGLTVLILLALFNSLRQALIALLSAPLSMIGVTAALLMTGRALDFISLLGILSLWGLLIRNAVLLVDRIDLAIEEGKPRPAAIMDAAMSRLGPLGLAAGTVILATLPLLQDDLFATMAMTIMAGLGVATLLGLVVVPVLYTTLFRIPNDETP